MVLLKFTIQPVVDKEKVLHIEISLLKMEGTLKETEYDYFQLPMNSWMSTYHVCWILREIF